MKKNILITGTPKSGKSTMLNKIIAGIENKVGLVANAVLSDGKRIGFEVETNTAEKETFSHINFDTKDKVSKYFVDTAKLEKVLTYISEFSETDTLYIDEIGEMQLFSEKFKNQVLSFLDSPNTSLVTVSKIFEHEFISDVLNREDVILVEISPENREEKEIFIKKLLRKIDKAKGYVEQPERFTREGDKVTLNSEHDIRILNHKDGEWDCSCDFFSNHKICSHVIATSELFS